MCSFIFSFMYYNTIISILNHLYRYLSFQVSVPSLKLAFCGYTHHMGRLRQKKCWTSYRVWRPKTSWDFWRRFAQILRCRGCGLFLCPRHGIPRCHTPSCATPVFGHKLHLISGVNPRESLHIHMYVCVGMCMYIGYIYICIYIYTYYPVYIFELYSCSTSTWLFRTFQRGCLAPFSTGLRRLPSSLDVVGDIQNVFRLSHNLVLVKFTFFVGRIIFFLCPNLCWLNHHFRLLTPTFGNFWKMSDTFKGLS